MSALEKGCREKKTEFFFKIYDLGKQPSPVSKQPPVLGDFESSDFH